MPVAESVANGLFLGYFFVSLDLIFIINSLLDFLYLLHMDQTENNLVQ